MGAQPIMHNYYFSFRLFAQGSLITDSSSNYQVLPEKNLLRKQDKDSFLSTPVKYYEYWVYYFCYPCGNKRKSYLADSTFLPFTVTIVRAKKDTMQLTFGDVIRIDSLPFLVGKFELTWGDIQKRNKKKEGYKNINWAQYRVKEIERKED